MPEQRCSPARDCFGVLEVDRVDLCGMVDEPTSPSIVPLFEIGSEM